MAALKVSTLDISDGEDDTLSTTGVRHLRIEVQKAPRTRGEKRSGPRKS